MLDILGGMEKFYKNIRRQSMKTKRNSNIELLRIIAGFMIVIGHGQSIGGGLAGTVGSNFFLSNIMATSANWGSHILAFIGFYYLIDKPFNGRSWCTLWLKVIYYYASVCLVGVVLGMGIFNTNMTDMIKNGLPIIGHSYWFATAYLIIMLISPFLNDVLSKVSDGSIKKLIIVTTIFFMIVPMLSLSNSTLKNNITLFIYMYILVYYIFKTKQIPKTVSNSIFIKISVATFFAIGICGYLWTQLCTTLNLKTDYSVQLMLSSRQSIFMILSALSMLIAFLKMKERHSGVINYISSATFGVYLFHCHPYLRNYIWDLLKYDSFFESISFFIYSLVIPIGFFCVSILMEIPFKIVCSWLFGRKAVNKLISKVERWFIIV